MPERVYDKINYQTNFTSTSTFAILLKAVKENEPVDSDYARATLFPQARSNAGMRYNPTIRDTHGEISLAQYGLIDYIDEKTFKLSALGNRFLELFNDDFTVKSGNEYNYISTMVDSLFSWYDKTYGRNINVGVLLFKLLLEDDLSNNITAEEWSYISEFSGVKTNADYQNLKEQIIQNRNNHATFPLKKANVFLDGLAGTWKLLYKTNNGTTDVYTLREISKKIIQEKFKQIFEVENFETQNPNFEVLTPERFKEKGNEFISEDLEASNIYIAFKDKFSSEKLASLNGEDLLNYLFLGGNRDNLCHELEYVNNNTHLFGSIKNGNSFKYPLFKRNGTRLTGSAKKPVSLTLEEAIIKGTGVRDKLAAALITIKGASQLTNVEDYLSLYTALYGIMPDLVDSLWVIKYFHMFFPSLFPVFYNKDWQLRVLNVLNIEPSDTTYGRLGQINAFVKECEISNVVFAQVFYKYCENLQILDNEMVDKDEPVDFDTCERLKTGSNIILYGVPGAGKSHTIKTEYLDKKTKTERVVFHPDYTYSDFVGQILPKSINGNVTYDFIPGPFTKIVRDAYRNPSEKFILIIEEINRGNAPAIFGDIFQLLDRDEMAKIYDETSKTYVENPNYKASEYGISNADVAKIVYENESHEVKLPSNLSIICTMNTSDQNVFTLDTAFQRRWNMRLIDNSFKKDTEEEKMFAETHILDTDVSWENFCETINAQILEKNQNMTSSEDKRLGTHFVNQDDLYFDDDALDLTKDGSIRKQAELRNRRFPEKIIKYLWDDAFKFYRDEIFKGEFNSLEKVISEFTSKLKNDRFNIFKDNIKGALMEMVNKSEKKE